MSKQEEIFDEQLKKLEEAIANRRKYGNYACGTQHTQYECKQPEYIPMGCAQVSASYIQQQPRHDDWDKTRVEILRRENETLTKRCSTLILENSKLMLELTRVMKENTELKTKKSKKKDFDVKVTTSLNKVGNGFTGLYQKFITWLNT